MAAGRRRLHGRAPRARRDAGRRGVHAGRPDLIAEYTRPDEFHQCFAFDLLLSPWHGESMRRAISEAFEHVRGPGRVADVHPQQPRHPAHRDPLGRQAITEAGGVDGRQPALRRRARSTSPLGTRRARAAAGLLLAMPGAVYLYQGEELGPARGARPARRRSPGPRVRPHRRRARSGRDGCRVPLPWTTARRHVRVLAAGRGRRAVAAAARPTGAPTPSTRRTPTTASMLALYRRLIAARRAHLECGEAELVDDHDDVVVLRRGAVVVACNVSGQPVHVAAAAGTRRRS